MARTTAMRRLDYILADENYGPKLARLRGSAEREVLNLIEQNRGQDARAAITRLDEQRRERARESSITTLRKRAYERLTTMWRGQPRMNTDTISANVALMTRDELRFSLTADYHTLVQAARESPDARPNVPEGTELNVFWYH